MKNLIVVESPTKSRTLSRFLGKDYDVVATMGHIKDLPKSKLGVDVEKDFEPNYVIVKKKSKAIKGIKDAVKKADKIFLATDPDREGEAIAEHAKQILKDSKVKISDEKIKRIVFHEITKSAVEDAINSPRGIDENLIDAQIARRVLDRLVGYKLSPLLWKKVRRGLSAGRVQSVAVRLIVEREREIEAFDPEEYWEIFVEVAKVEDVEEGKFTVKLRKIDDKKADIKNKKQADEAVDDLEKADYKVQEVKRKEVKRNPYPPFTTSTISQTASRFYSWSSKKTMAVAQRLYEEGLITYHRTDSTNISKDAAASVRDYIKKEYGEDYLPEKTRVYKTKSKVAQEAHEAIRPTKVETKVGDDWPISGSFSKDTKRLYELIWKRFVACQMAASVYDKTTIDVSAEQSSQGKIYLLRVTGRVMKFDGWRKVIPSSKDKSESDLPKVNDGDPLQLIKVDPQQKFTQPPARYNEASIIKTLEKMGIGRPSTYAPTISTIQTRRYVEKEKGRFHPTPIGFAVNDFLVKHFEKVMDYSFTAKMEDQLDEVANGEIEWQKMMKEFWGPFEEKLETVEEKAERVKIETEKLDKPCPECEEGELVIRTGRYGKFISCSRFPDCDYKDKYVEKIGMDCPECKKGDIIVKKTRRGKKFYGCSTYPDCEWASWKDPREDREDKDNSNEESDS